MWNLAYLNINKACYVEKYLYYPLGHPPNLLYYETFCNAFLKHYYLEKLLYEMFSGAIILALICILPLELSTPFFLE